MPAARAATRMVTPSTLARVAPAWARVTLSLALLGGPLGLAGCGDASGSAEEGGKGRGGKKGEWGKGRGGGKGGKGRGGKGGDGEMKPAEPLPVAVLTPEAATIERFYKTSGTLRALRTADLVATQSGVVLDLKVEEGDTVTEGQVLARLDGRAFQLQAARDSVTAKNAAAELERLNQIAASGAVTREELDKQRYAVEQALASAKVSRHQVAQTQVVAPFAGTITARHVDIGNLASPATPIYALADLSTLDVDLHVPEADAAEVAVDSPVELELLDGSKMSATIVRRAPIVDALTGTVKFVARARELPKAAIPGAFARARVRVASRQAALSLPGSAIVEVEGKPNVFVVDDGKAKRLEVTLGIRGEERVEIVDGLPGDATVIADVGGGITEGMPVRPLGAEGEAAAGSEDRSEGTGPDGEPGEGRKGGRRRGEGKAGEGKAGEGKGEWKGGEGKGRRRERGKGAE
ncbi:MAG: efflux RND transporter periplasmic adaptor subunit [Nannocystaceae bacterium]